MYNEQTSRILNNGSYSSFQMYAIHIKLYLNPFAYAITGVTLPLLYYNLRWYDHIYADGWHFLICGVLNTKSELPNYKLMEKALFR